MKKPLFLAFTILSTAGSLLGQTIIDSNSFFDPDFKVRRFGATSGTVNLSVNNTSISQTSAPGTYQWTHSAGGHVQARTFIPVVANLDVQLAAYTRTRNDSLVFGREFTSTAQLLGGIVDVGDEVEGLVNQVAGASVLYKWDSTATVSGLAIVPDQLYRVDFSVTSGSGLPANILNAATFGITTSGITGASNQSAQLLNVLDLLTIGSDSSTGNFSFLFKSDQNLSALDFNFAATSGVGVKLLGGTLGNQNVLTFSGFQVAAVPEPGTATMCGGMLCFLAFRRSRGKASGTPTPCES